jgi:hypothetical protein
MLLADRKMHISSTTMKNQPLADCKILSTEECREYGIEENMQSSETARGCGGCEKQQTIVLGI